MKHYLSFGGGVNSVALYLLMQDLGMDFEAVFVDHGGDWPETYEYFDYFVSTGRPVTVLKPEFCGTSSIVEYCDKYRLTPNRVRRWCTSQWKVVPLHKYFERPCFAHLGIDAGESKRAKISSEGGIENRFLLIEHDIDRDGCVDMIRRAGLDVPRKSGCWFCPFQRLSQWRELRRKHPDLFCKAVSQEKLSNERRAEHDKDPIYTIRKDYPLELVVSESRESQKALPGMEELEYPPCQCGL